MKKLLLAAMAAFAAASLTGCGAREDAFQSMTLPTSDYQAVFQAAQDVIQREYLVQKVAFAEGVIETRPKLVEKTGAQRELGAYITSGSVQSFRQSVTCRISRDLGETTVRIAVNVQREGTSQAETLLVGREGGDRRDMGAEGGWKHLDEARATYWADVGRNKEAEQQLLDKIRDRLGMGSPSEGAETSELGGGRTTSEQLRQEAEQY